MTRLRTCQACARHVFTSEPSCPFCKTQLAAAADPAAVAIPSSASRAQRLALAAAISGTALLGCAADDPQATDAQATAGASGGSAGQAAPSVPPGGGVAVPVYGAPVPGGPGPAPQAGRGPQPTAGNNGTITVPVYGAPVAGSSADEDAGVPEAGNGAAGSGSAAGRGAAGSGGTTGPIGGNIAVPVYGAPIPEYGAPPPPKD
jgi:hypothetical protein